MVIIICIVIHISKVIHTPYERPYNCTDTTDFLCHINVSHFLNPKNKKPDRKHYVRHEI